MKSLFSAKTPRVFSIAPHRPFLDDLAVALLAELADPKNPFALADATVLVPNRRAARELAAAFLRAAGEDPPATLLPAIRALGDVDEDEPPFEPGELALAAPPAVSSARRRFELAALVHAKAALEDERADPAAALPLADELGKLLDEIAATGKDEVDFTAIEREMAERLPAHLARSALFLQIVREHWPKRLRELDRIDAADRREQITHALAERWRTAPPAAPVIAAGSTGSQAATREVLAAVARLPQGAVVLPGLDADLDDRAWKEIDDGHPQFNLKRTLETLKLDRDKVRPWPGSEEKSEARTERARRRLINEALRPAPATDDWLERIAALNKELKTDVAIDGLVGLAVLEAPTPDAEARAVALATRQALEEQAQNGAGDVLIITPDLSLADRIEAALTRFGVEADMSAGRPLLETRPGAFLAHVLALAQDSGDPVAICALAKHELTALGRTHRAARIRFADIERRALRGVRPGQDLGAVARKVANENGGPEARALIADLAEAIAPLCVLDDGAPHLLADWARAHVAAAEEIARDATLPGADRLWREEAGEGAAALMRELLEESASFPAITLDAYARAYERLARARAIRRRAADEPRVRILGPIEARLQSAGLVIAAGLNEGTWPARPGEDPFVSRGMRRQAGLPPPEQRLSLAAHDFAQLACAPRVLLTRAVRDDSGPTVASRWLWRLSTLVRSGKSEDEARATLQPAYDYVALVQALDRVGPDEARPVERPEARPPVAARPRKLSATRVAEWVRDPYGLYARRVLRLKPLDPLDKPPGALERGNAVHGALEDLVRAWPDALPDDFADRLAALAVEKLKDMGFTHAELALQEPRTRRAARWFADWEQERRAEGWRWKLLETKGEASFAAPQGAFTIEAKADRIDLGPAGPSILDYKTGSPPSEKEAQAGLAPQLGLEGAILMLGGFPEMPAKAPAQLVYLRLQGGRNVGQEKLIFDSADGAAAADHAKATLDGVKRRVFAYDDPTTAYRSRARVQKTTDTLDFDRLARVKEWATPDEEEA